MNKLFEIGGKAYSFTAEENVDIAFEQLSDENGISVFKVRFDWGRLCSPKKITLYYEMPCRDMYNTWDALSKTRHIAFGGDTTESYIAFGMPLKALFSKNGDNRYLLTVSDVKSPLKLNFGSHYQNAIIKVKIDFFSALTGPFDSYETFIRVDERSIPFDIALKDAYSWFASFGYKNSAAPELARRPMYSTWYSYGQTLRASDVLRECREAVKYGMKTVIIDDGWQMDNPDGLYKYCGDWEPTKKKFPDMAGMVEKLHAMGIKVMLWYAVPFMGYGAKRVKEFEGMYLRGEDGICSYVLDPRYKKVRDYIVKTYTDAIVNWGLDGLKLDFINRFMTNGKVTPEMDFVSVEDALECLLKELKDEFYKINPELLIEFRQPYFGPIVTTYGNMLRVWDCPLDGITNKNSTLNLRLCAPECAIHSDMIYWHRDETPQGAATQLLGTVFSVPQISTRMSELTREQKAVLKTYLDFWNAHRDTLLDGELRVNFAENGYGYASSVLGTEKIALAATRGVLDVEQGIENAYLFNITSEERIFLKIEADERYAIEVFDCTGKRSVRRRLVRQKLSEVNVPIGGMLKVSLYK